MFNARYVTNRWKTWIQYYILFSLFLAWVEFINCLQGFGVRLENNVLQLKPIKKSKKQGINLKGNKR